MADGQVIVTGGSKGIGLAIASELDRRGVPVVCVSRSGGGSIGQSVACDVTDEAAVRRVFTDIAGRGPIAGLVNNAGVHIGGPIATLATVDFERTIALNLTAVMVAAREVYPYLREHGGMIINIGSYFDKLGVPDNLAYCASKAAVGAMTRCMAVEWARDRPQSRLSRPAESCGMDEAAHPDRWPGQARRSGTSGCRDFHREDWLPQWRDDLPRWGTRD
jgi:NAD(P)-dependent dehydrogenase (short-subunit alcohol dehydrogenase family)